MSRKKETHSPDMPTAVWSGTDLLDGQQVETLTMIFHTTGCHWSHKEGCTMCGYFNDSATGPVSEENLLSQMDAAMKKMRPGTSLVKIFTSGSFFDDREVPSSTRIQILERIAKTGSVKKIIAETRPEFVSDLNLITSLGILDKHDIRLEIAVGLETSSDSIRKDCINKGFSFTDFSRASHTAGELGVSTKAYLLLKPPFLSERTAVDDILASVHETAPYATTISLNLCNVQKGTLVEELFHHGDYRPPWLWSAVFILKKAKELFPEVTFLSDPVAAGTKRGPRNCGKCDSDVAGSLRDFSINQDTRIFSHVECSCHSLWEKVMGLEGKSFGAHLL